MSFADEKGVYMCAQQQGAQESPFSRKSAGLTLGRVQRYHASIDHIGTRGVTRCAAVLPVLGDHRLLSTCPTIGGTPPITQGGIGYVIA